VSPLDPTTLPWPYTGEPPSRDYQRLGGIAFIAPDPASGIQVLYGVSDYYGPAGGGSLEYIRITNGRSTAIVALDGTRAPENQSILAADAQAFERYWATIRVCGSEGKC
jgi:hypothetical protein